MGRRGYQSRSNRINATGGRLVPERIMRGHLAASERAAKWQNDSGSRHARARLERH